MRATFFISLVVFGAFGAGCAKDTIAHQQTEVDANLILVLLNREGGIEADKLQDEKSRDLRFNVMVTKSQASQSLSILHKYNLPKTPAADSEAMFREGGMIPTPEQQRAKREVGIRGDIMNSLRSVPRVVDVKAVVTLPEDNPLRDVNEAKPKPKASVILIYLEDVDGKPPLSVEDVQRYVQASLPDVKASEVSVNMFSAESASAKAIGGSAAVPIIDPMKGCMEKDLIIGIEVCAGSKKRVINLMFGTAAVAVILSGFVVLAALRAMRYRKDLTRLTAQFQNVKSK